MENIMYGGLVVLLIAVVYLFHKVRQLSRSIPKLEKGQRLAPIREGESNLTIIRKGVDALVSDEEGNLIPFKTEVN